MGPTRRNVGAFGEGVFKIGMTRRLDPLERVDEPIYTMAGTCALNGVQPLAYFTDVLRKLETERFPLSRIDELLPPNWVKTAPASALVRPSR